MSWLLSYAPAGRPNLWDFEVEVGRLEREAAALAYRNVDAVVATSQAVADETTRRRHIAPERFT